MALVLCVPVSYTILNVPEHHGHYDELGSPIHNNNTIEGTFSQGTSKCKVTGVNVLADGDTSSEICSDIDGEGVMDSLPSKCKVEGRYIAISGSSVVSHGGVSKELTGGNAKMSVGGI